MTSQSYYGKHQDLMKEIILAGQKAYPNMRLFPADCGLFYTKRGTPVKVGVNGQCDLNGWIEIDGRGLRIEVEIKSGKSRVKRKSAQGKWRDVCQQFGVIYIEATSVDQFLGELDGILKGFK